MEKNKTKKHFIDQWEMQNYAWNQKCRFAQNCSKHKFRYHTISLVIKVCLETNQITDWWKYNCIETAKTDWINMKRWHPWQPKMNHIRFASVVKDAERLREIVRGKKDRRRRRRLGGWIWISKSVSHMPHVTLLQSSPIFKWIIKKRGC